MLINKKGVWMKTFYKIFILAFSTVLLTSSLTARELEETFKKVVSVETAKRLTLENRNGSIEVRGWDRDEIEVIAYKKVRANNRDTAERLMEELKISITERGDEIEVITDYPDRGSSHNGGFLSWLMGGFGNRSYSVSYVIRVPQKFDLDISSTNGRLEILDCNGRLRLETTNGKILADDVSGSVRCKTTNGSIKVTMMDVEEDDEMSFTSTNGSIKLYLPSQIDAEIRARTTNGSISCDLPITEEYSRSRKRLEATINDGGMMIYLKTTNGSIRIRES
jgi:DUF4097 and DUF4098 domain-containing protein YvlB